jgi:Skp family chaperone for outer membrane proteins
MRLRAALLGLFLSAAAGLPAAAQDFGTPISPILIIDQERLFAESRLGEYITRQIEAAAEDLAAENRRIETELIAEELALTEERANLAPEAFRELADAFDEKVQRLREEQDAKERALNLRREEERQEFLARIAPVIGALARERGAVAILDRRAVFLAAGSIDVTEVAIARLNEAIDVEEAAETDPPPLDEDIVVTPGSPPPDPDAEGEEIGDQ